VHNLKRFLWREKENHSIYIRCSLGACFLGFALFTLSLHYIYTRWSLSACSCSLHTLSPAPDLNKTSLASLSLSLSLSVSLSPLTASQRADRIRPPGREGGLTLLPSVRMGIHYRRSYSLSPSGGAGGPPTPSSSPPYIVWAKWPSVAHRTRPQEP